MQLIVGIGNPGVGYARNRHNIGAIIVDRIADAYAFPGFKTGFNGLLSRSMIADFKVILLKPQTFVNLSGQSVSAAANFFKIDTADITIIHDDLDLIPGIARLKQGGGTAGHNGLKSISAHIGPDYWRLRMGIGHPGAKHLVSNWVLGDFSNNELAVLDPLVDGIVASFKDIITRAKSRFG